MKIVYEKFRRQHNTQKHKWHHAEHWWNKNRRLQFKREIELASFYAVLLLLSQIARCLTFSFPFLSCSRFNMSQMAIKVHNDYYCCYFDGEYDVCFRMLHSTGSSFLPSSHCDVAEQFWRKFLCFTHVTVIKMFLVVADVVDVVDAAAKAINKKIRSQHSAIFLLLQLRFLSYHSIINFFWMLAAEFVYSRERHWNFNRRKHDEGYFLPLKRQWITPQNRTFTKVDKKIRSQCSNSLSICFFFAIYFAQLLPQIHYQ